MSLTPHELGKRVSEFARHSSKPVALLKLRGFLADLMGQEDLLLLPIQSVIASPYFRRIIESSSVHSAAHINSCLNELSGLYTPEVLNHLRDFLTGLAGNEPALPPKKNIRFPRRDLIVVSSILLACSLLFALYNQRLNVASLWTSLLERNTRTASDPVIPEVEIQTTKKEDARDLSDVNTISEPYTERITNAENAISEAHTLVRRYATYMFPFRNCLMRDLRFGPKEPESECGKIQIQETELLSSARSELFRIPESSELYSRAAMLLKSIERLEDYRRADSHWIEMNGSGWCGSGGCMWPEPGKHGRPPLPQTINQ